MPNLSIIIPTLNEAEALPVLLSQLAQQEHIELDIIVADGGSTDTTRQLAREQGARVIKTKQPGRGRQLNAGADYAQTEWLLFLHADSQLQDPQLLSKALHALQQRIQHAGHPHIAGHFPLHFLQDQSEPERYHPEKFAYRYTAAKTHLNRVNTTNGDQGFLLSKNFFQSLGGFDESMGFLEDQRLAETIRNQGQWITLPGLLATSARRFETEGFVRRYTLMAVIMAAHMTNTKEFFDMAPSLYAAQSDTGKLLLSRYSAVIWPMIRRIPKGRRLSTLLAYGAYVRENCWQLFFLLDVRRHSEADITAGQCDPRWVRWHDRYVAPVINWKIVDAGIGASIIIWFANILGLYYRVKDRTELRKTKRNHSINNHEGNPN